MMKWHWNKFSKRWELERPEGFYLIYSYSYEEFEVCFAPKVEGKCVGISSTLGRFAKCKKAKERVIDIIFEKELNK